MNDKHTLVGRYTTYANVEKIVDAYTVGDNLYLLLQDVKDGTITILDHETLTDYTIYDVVSHALAAQGLDADGNPIEIGDSADAAA